MRHAIRVERADVFVLTHVQTHFTFVFLGVVSVKMYRTAVFQTQGLESISLVLRITMPSRSMPHKLNPIGRARLEYGSRGEVHRVFSSAWPTSTLLGGRFRIERLDDACRNWFDELQDISCVFLKDIPVAERRPKRLSVISAFGIVPAN